ncbi:hypothetical protein [Streptomyces sp. H27-C3]|uniref:hypothetical protein n=1 Tax=Streptomyces sp. H27-C3 TaxID=3046305 RepID=UPI0024B91CF6|nr:hypothetical protein [Streptomyces sp. H27-C3]MDJ0462616.1 hypothetical protein [Streptomyces sp. H27-C3]
MSDSKPLGALSGHPYYRVGYPWRDGTVDPGSGVASLVRPFEEKERFGEDVRENVAPWLRESHPDAVLSTYTGVRRLVPGRVDRLKGDTLFCDRPDERKRCLGRHAVAVTTDLKGKPVGEPKVIRDARIGNGSLRLPPPRAPEVVARPREGGPYRPEERQGARRRRCGVGPGPHTAQ